ncbi:MAG: hypothetical protein JNK72_15790 [Myxococcales bacterium]|nr:hypothetical protein [Myxococcales bacterium]
MKTWPALRTQLMLGFWGLGALVTSCQDASLTPRPAATASASSAVRAADAGPARPTVRCDAPLSPCGDRCVLLSFDQSNCGACGHRCPEGADCANGQCRCNPGYTLTCEGRCTNPMADNNHCGACGQRCVRGQICSGGRCLAITCPEGQTKCGNICADLQTDTENCGICTSVCPTGGSCVAGHCQCPTGSNVCGLTCANLEDNHDHCGACFYACNDNQQCVNGHCTPEVRCEAGLTMCRERCVNTQSDAENCGGCGRRCTIRGGFVGQCVAGECRDAGPGAPVPMSGGNGPGLRPGAMR